MTGGRPSRGRKRNNRRQEAEAAGSAQQDDVPESEEEGDAFDSESRTADQVAPGSALLAATESGPVAPGGSSTQAPDGTRGPTQTTPTGRAGNEGRDTVDIPAILRSGLLALRTAIKADVVRELTGLRAEISSTRADVKALKEQVALLPRLGPSIGADPRRDGGGGKQLDSPITQRKYSLQDWLLKSFANDSLTFFRGHVVCDLSLEQARIVIGGGAAQPWLASAMWAKKGSNASSSSGDTSTKLDNLARRTIMLVVAHVLRRKLFYFAIGTKSAEQGGQQESRPQQGEAMEQVETAKQVAVSLKHIQDINNYSFDASSAFAWCMQCLSRTSDTGLKSFVDGLSPSVLLWEAGDGLGLKRPPPMTVVSALLICVEAAAMQCSGLGPSTPAGGGVVALSAGRQRKKRRVASSHSGKPGDPASSPPGNESVVAKAFRDLLDLVGIYVSICRSSATERRKAVRYVFWRKAGYAIYACVLGRLCWKGAVDNVPENADDLSRVADASVVKRERDEHQKAVSASGLIDKDDKERKKKAIDRAMEKNAKKLEALSSGPLALVCRFTVPVSVIGGSAGDPPESFESIKKMHDEVADRRQGISFYRGDEDESAAAEHFYLSLSSTLSFHILAHDVLCAATGTPNFLATSKDSLRTVHVTALSLRAACRHALAHGDLSKLTSEEKLCMGALRVFQTTPAGERQGAPEGGERQNTIPGVVTVLRYPWDGANEIQAAKTSANRAAEEDLYYLHAKERGSGVPLGEKERELKWDSGDLVERALSKPVYEVELSDLRAQVLGDEIADTSASPVRNVQSGTPSDSNRGGSHLSATTEDAPVQSLIADWVIERDSDPESSGSDHEAGGRSDAL